MTLRMSLSGANRKTSTLELRELLNTTERSRLLEQLGAKRGVCSAYFSAGEPQRLSVEYDADLVSALGILEFLESCALRPQLSLRRGPLPAAPPVLVDSALVDAAFRPAPDRTATRT